MATPGNPGKPSVRKTGDRVKAGGRQKGVPNKIEVTEQMRVDILKTYQQCGGQKAMLAYAKSDFPGFVKQCLSRLMPGFSSPEPLVQINNTQVNTTVDTIVPSGPWSKEVEIARRISFLIAKVANEQRIYEPATSRTIEAPKLEPAPTHEPPPDVDLEQYGSDREQGIRRRKLI